MNRKMLRTAAIFGILAVIFGAFGAHSLKAKISLSELDVWKTAVEYQFYHSIALLVIAAVNSVQNKLLNWSYWFFTAGIILFSGSLYLISLKNILNIQQISILGPVTPLGGLFFIAGWLCLLIYSFKNK